MATTESRPGFRLPWSADRLVPRRSDETDVASRPLPTRAGARRRLRCGRGHRRLQCRGARGRLDGRPAYRSPPRPPAPALAPTPDWRARARRRPTKFLARHDACDAGRRRAGPRRDPGAVPGRGRGLRRADPGHARPPTRTRSAGAPTGDIASIKDWSKAEIARIREETETRIVAGAASSTNSWRVMRRWSSARSAGSRRGRPVRGGHGGLLRRAPRRDGPDGPGRARRADAGAAELRELDETAFTELMHEPAAGPVAPAAADRAGRCAGGARGAGLAVTADTMAGTAGRGAGGGGRNHRSRPVRRPATSR